MRWPQGCGAAGCGPQRLRPGGACPPAGPQRRPARSWGPQPEEDEERWPASLVSCLSDSLARCRRPTLSSGTQQHPSPLSALVRPTDRSAGLALCLAAVSAQKNIVETAQADPELRFLVDAVVAGGLAATLSGPGPFTVFAPINQAFDQVGRNIDDFLFNPFNLVSLDNVLTYHVVSGSVYAKDLKDGEIVPTVDAGFNVTVHINGQVVRINEARVLRADIQCSNGVIHVVDGVLVPGNIGLPADDIVKTAVGVPALSTLVTAVQTAGLVEALSLPNGPYTVFAPSNDAFAALPAGVLAYLLAHPQELADVLFYHL